ncbi:hypothetical protein [Pontibacter roseus]|uniref:hypothetical protein n=1 Tax=Pontibacter roseus TaxID=336989 RepID=UPI000371A2DA|nr:hypothetical protein [Pontibacter roseus]
MITLRSQLRVILFAVLLLLAFLFSGCEAEEVDTTAPLKAQVEADKKGVGPQRPVSAYHNKVLAQVRQATARYHHLEAALADGYELGSPCVSSPAGGMGHHYIKGTLVDGTIDPTQPEVLVYEPMKNGKMRLVAVEFLVVAEPWDAQHDSAPRLGNQVYDDHRDFSKGGPPFPHYQLHAWVWKHNPSGMHAAFNPNVTCDYAD